MIAPRKPTAHSVALASLLFASVSGCGGTWDSTGAAESDADLGAEGARRILNAGTDSRIVPDRILASIDGLDVQFANLSRFGSGCWGPWALDAFISERFSQRIAVGPPAPASQESDAIPSATGVSAINNTLFVEFNERSPSTGHWTLYTLAYSCTREIVSVDARGANEFFLLLRDRHQVLSVERWRIDVAPGGWVAARAEWDGKALILPPVAKAKPEIVGGGQYLSIRERDYFSTASRERIVPGLQVPPDCFFVVPDPDGRFFLLVSPRRVDRVDLNSGLVTPLIEATDLQTSSQEISQCVISGEPDTGRLLEVYVSRTHWGPLAFDADNDGVFESKCTPADDDEWDLLTPLDRSWAGDL